MALAFVIFVIGVLILKKIRVALEWTGREQVYLFALLTIAMLIKGPIVYAFLLPGIVLFQCTRRRRAVVAGVDDPAQHSVPDGDDRGCSHGAVSPCVNPCERCARCERLARLVAMACFARDFSSVGNWRHSVSAGILRGSCGARIRRPLW
jgi:hypothetical protein